MPKVCPKCWRKFADDVTSCPDCGVDLQAGTGVEQKNRNPVSSNAGTCSHCGRGAFSPINIIRTTVIVFIVVHLLSLALWFTLIKFGVVKFAFLLP